MEVEFSSKGMSNFLYMEKNLSYSFRNEIDKMLILVVSRIYCYLYVKHIISSSNIKASFISAF